MTRKTLDNAIDHGQRSEDNAIARVIIQPAKSTFMPITVNQDGEIITFSLIGADRDDGFVRLSELAECFGRIQECLRETERCITGKNPHLTYLMKSLTVGSPAVGVIEAKKPRRSPDIRRQVATEFRKTISGLQRGVQLRKPMLDHDAYFSYRKLGEIINQSDHRARPGLILDGTVVTRQYLIAADRALEFQETASGSISGLLEKIDVHGRNQFAIFPPIGSHQVSCIFSDTLLPKVQAALKCNVTVYGKLHYVADRFIPAKVDVSEIEVHPSGDLPKLSTMAGRLSHLAGDSVQLIKEQRDVWE